MTIRALVCLGLLNVVAIPVIANNALAKESLAELTEQVRATEIAFAKTLADRDAKAFARMIAPDVIWLAEVPLRGPAQVLTRWRKFFDAPQPPFSWAPETVEVQEGGKLRQRQPVLRLRRTDAAREAKELISRGMATDYPVTMAIRVLRRHGVSFTPHLYTWEARGGTRASAEHLGVDEHAVVKTLVFETDAKQPLCVLMHGDREVSAKNLARQLGHRSVAPCAPDVADRHSGYQVGGTSPFGLKRRMPVYCEKSIGSLSLIYINGGARGFLVGIAPADLVRVLAPTMVEVAIA